MDSEVKKKQKNGVKGGLNNREKFVKLAESRTVNAIRAIRVIGKLGNKSHYEYSDSDVKKIVGVLGKEIETLKQRMSSTGGREAVEFKL